MSLTQQGNRPGPVASLALGLPVPMLFALYSVYLGAIRPAAGLLRILASVQAACFACAATAIVGFLVLVVRSEVRETFSRLRANFLNLIWLNLFTVLGPPLYFVAVILLGAAAANWIDLGATPLITFGIGTLTADVWLRLWKHHRVAARSIIRLKIAAVSLAVIGVGGVTAEVLAHETEGGTHLLGVLIALLSAVGTAASGHFLGSLQKGSPPLSAGALLPLRYTLPALVLAGFWTVQSRRAGAAGIVLQASPATYVAALLGLYVLPNYLYVLVLKKKGLLYSGYLWALLPVFASMAEWVFSGREGVSLSPMTSIAGGLLILGAAVLDARADAKAGEFEKRLNDSAPAGAAASLAAGSAASQPLANASAASPSTS